MLWKARATASLLMVRVTWPYGLGRCLLGRRLLGMPWRADQENDGGSRMMRCRVDTGTGVVVIVAMTTCNIRSARLPSSRITALHLLLSLAEVRLHVKAFVIITYYFNLAVVLRTYSLCVRRCKLR